MHLSDVDPALKAERLYQARAAYLSGDYAGALEKALQSNHEGWHVAGAAACALQDTEWVMRAAANLSLPERNWLQAICRRRGVAVLYLDSDRPRAFRIDLKPAGHVDEDE